jgi:hypothetical protein
MDADQMLRAATTSRRPVARETLTPDGVRVYSAIEFEDLTDDRRELDAIMDLVLDGGVYRRIMDDGVRHDFGVPPPLLGVVRRRYEQIVAEQPSDVVRMRPHVGRVHALTADWIICRICGRRTAAGQRVYSHRTFCAHLACMRELSDGFVAAMLGKLSTAGAAQQLESEDDGYAE